MDVCKVVDELILEQDLPVRANMRPVRMFDGLYPEGEEAEAYWDFIRWYLVQDHLVLMAVPMQEKGSFRLPIETDDSLSFPFSSADFQRGRKGFNLEHWRTRKVLEKVEDLALLYSVLSGDEARKRVRSRAVDLIKSEFGGDRWRTLRAVNLWNKTARIE